MSARASIVLALLVLTGQTVAASGQQEKQPPPAQAPIPARSQEVSPPLPAQVPVPAPTVDPAPPATLALPPSPPPPPRPLQAYIHPWQEQVRTVANETPARTAAVPVISTDKPSSKFAVAFAEAKVPDCLHAEGLKRQPPHIGPFVFMGVLAFPFVALAKIRGKCI